MPRIVQKYGGTSVGDVDRIKNVANRIKAVRDAGNELVVVVSARAGVTNELIARAKAITALPSEREMDQLLAVGEQETIALTAMALHAISLLTQRRLIDDIERHRGDAQLIVLPPPCPLSILPIDFGRAEKLIAQAALIERCGRIVAEMLQAAAEESSR